ncbi:TY-Chap domain-containing protein [Nocardia sp. 004]|uniref:TY-Chap domain-containing protein n=1 Tax=Nocardia sp. 004 TaxID=3385978 RepID=UPI0039A28FD6
MGLRKFWRRGESDAARAGLEVDRTDIGAAEDAVWDWFAAGLAWTLFTLPEESILTLADGDDTSSFAQFRKDCGLRAEVGTASYGGGSMPEHELVLAERGWALPDEDNNNWYQDLDWPARYTDYEQLAESVALALRNVSGVWLPLGLQSETWNDGSDQEPDISEIAAYGLTAERLRTMEPATLYEFAEAGQRKLGQAKLMGLANHQVKTIVANSFLDSEGWELLVGGGDLWPVRDRTVDFIALAGPDRLVAIDVVIDVESFDDIEFDNRVIAGKRVERGTTIFVDAMVRADPDLTGALAARGELAAFHEGRFRLDYKLLAMDSDHNVSSFDIITEAAENPQSTASQPAPPALEEVDDRRYPLLKPADWAHRGLVRHRITGPGAAPIAVLAADRDGQYTIDTEYPETIEFQALWASAIANLEALNYDWEIAEVATIPFANCSGRDFSAEKILDPNAMRVVHHFLKAPRLWVSVPRRTCLMAVPTTLNPTQTMAFGFLVQRTFEDDSYGHAPITRGVYVVEDGHIVDFVEDPESLYAD